MQPTPDVFPGPFAAVFLTLAALFAMALMVTALSGELPFIAAVGIGQVIGMGGVAALSARRVPPPHDERIGLRGFAPKLLVALVCLLPVVIVVSELDNWMRLAAQGLDDPMGLFGPPPPELAEQREKIAEMLAIDSVYAAVQTVIVAVGIGPVIEGFFFFGVLLQGSVARMGRVRGVFLVAVLYSIAHFPASGAPGGAVVPLASALIIGSLLGLARLGSGSVIAAMGLAGAFAAIQLGAAKGSEYVPIAGFNAPGDHTPAVIVVPCVISVLYGIWTLSRGAMVARTNPPVPAESRDDDDEGGRFFF